MTELLTAAQMRAIEQAAIARGEVTGLELMERAGCGVVEATFEEWPDYRTSPQSVSVFCGPGNNGGDGFVVARLLKHRGWAVTVWFHGDRDRLPADARANHDRWMELGEIHVMDRSAFRAAPGTTLYIDAMFGTGLTRPVQGEVAAFAQGWDRSCARGCRVVAVDIPSGLCTDGGRVLGTAVPADLTVTFHRAKVGHELSAGPALSGRVVVKDIGLNHPPGDGPPSQVATMPSPAVGAGTAMSPGDVVELIDGPASGGLGKADRAHKYAHGHALILSGGAGRTGAARLAARGALRIGAGLVTLGVPGAAQMEVASQMTAIMLRRVDDRAGLAQVLEDDRLNAICLGPGLGVARARELVPVALRVPAPEPGPRGGPGSSPGRGVVLDADALSAYGDAPETLFGLLHDRCVLTPHGGEFARLFPDLAEKLNAAPARGPTYSKVDAVREAAARAGCVVLFKGPDTVIAVPDGRCSINAAQYERAAPWLATAGSGDVLAGFIAGLLARGFAPMQAAETAAWLHVECALSFGPGLIAEDLPERLPTVFRDLGL